MSITTAEELWTRPVNTIMEAMEESAESRGPRLRGCRTAAGCRVAELGCEVVGSVGTHTDAEVQTDQVRTDSAQLQVDAVQWVTPHVPPTKASASKRTPAAPKMIEHRGNKAKTKRERRRSSGRCHPAS